MSEHAMSPMKQGKSTQLLNRQAYSYRRVEPLTEALILGVTALILFDQLETTHADLAELFDVIRTMPNDARVGELRPRIVRQLNRIIAQLGKLKERRASNQRHRKVQLQKSA
jgi:hypothetical protein